MTRGGPGVAVRAGIRGCDGAVGISGGDGVWRDSRAVTAMRWRRERFCGRDEGERAEWRRFPGRNPGRQWRGMFLRDVTLDRRNSRAGCRASPSRSRMTPRCRADGADARLRWLQLGCGREGSACSRHQRQLGQELATKYIMS
ncbi:hypothetical protein E2562_031746 [Oryza meyeriana var. granulata]|uniref:Uncharacterized protein n=1 Tax=Oryza meyeriana var. granulata TaxID=110450 RepID=A0A6G1CVA2_9ORYZ|nr:hypothetical protein E2562_031746 [Oryza meyeriana var. granulata]